MNAFTRSQLAGLALLIAAAGCDTPKLPTAPPTATPVAAPEAEPERPMVAGAPGEPLPEIETPVTATPRKFTSHDPIKGRRSRRAGGYLGAVGGARFHAEYQTIINNIDHALQLYNAEHGEFPKSHEEFMQKIIQANNIVLPEIEPQHEYIYVPEQPEMGLQIRLKPGGAGEAAPPAEGADGQQPPADEAAAEEPSPDIRTRAGQLGDQRNEEVEKHGLAPGGLVPVGGLE
ncbi:MAG: hypothetical protein DCC67_21040 [Planctomycetota bacterium]|nr:MAG: hypothetical protein DCC67_21040 [Planctomycetota bacterium]